MIAGCGSSGPFATDPGQSVLVDDATSFSLVSSGGGLPGPRPQGACDPQIWMYTVRMNTSEIVWDRCDVTGDWTDAASYTRSTGSRVMPASELDAARSAARQVHVSGRINNCGADKPTWHLSVASDAGSMVYGDDFYACTHQDDHYVLTEELDSLYTELRSLDHP